MDKSFPKDKSYEKIIETYKLTKSVLETARKLNTYPIKVRRVLITEGLWESKTSAIIVRMHSQGISVKEIASQLFLSEKNIQSYLPYSRGCYNAKKQTSNGARSREYRERMKIANDNQVLKRIERGEEITYSKHQSVRANVDNEYGGLCHR